MIVLHSWYDNHPRSRSIMSWVQARQYYAQSRTRRQRSAPCRQQTVTELVNCMVLVAYNRPNRGSKGSSGIATLNRQHGVRPIAQYSRRITNLNRHFCPTINPFLDLYYHIMIQNSSKSVSQGDLACLFWFSAFLPSF